METRNPYIHLPSGECTVTLEDVSMLLHLKIDGQAITGSTSNNVLSDYAHWLGCDVDDINVNGNTIFLTWLRERLDTIPANPTPEDLLIYILGCIFCTSLGPF
jgi:hypothetical protein